MPVGKECRAVAERGAARYRASFMQPIAASSWCIRPGTSVRRRGIGLLAGLAAFCLLFVAASLEPAAEGFGTHRQLGLPSCGWIVAMNVPCFTCGMTTSFAYAASGNLVASLKAQPFGFLLSVATAGCALTGLYIAVTGSRVAHLLPQLWSARLNWILGGLLLLAWGYKLMVHRGII